MRRVVSILSTFFASISLFSQDLSFSVNQNIISPPPNAASLTQYYNVPVSVYTGKPDIALDLFKFKSGEFDIPISLNYDPMGIRVSDVAPRTGVGWILNCGGVITRAVVGLPDEQPNKGFNDRYYRLPEKDSRTIRPWTNDIRLIASGEVDSEADIYSFSAVGTGGRIINRGSEYVTQPVSNFKIVKKVSSNNSIIFQILDGKGNEYNFEAIEFTQVVMGEIDYFVPTAWYLTKLVNANRTDSIEFIYDDHLYHHNADYSETRYERISGTVNLPTAYNTQNQQIFGKLLTKIKGSRGELEFYYSDRMDCDDKKLEKLILFDKINVREVKKISFNYGYYSNNSKLKLINFTVGTDALVEGVYNFEYNGNGIPHGNSKSQDHWGFFNNRNNSQWIPTFINQQGQVVTGADREPDATAMTEGILKKIIYPTGGYSEFLFEPNEYSQSVFGALDDELKFELESKNFVVTGNNSSSSFVEGNVTIDYAQITTLTYRIGNCRGGEWAQTCQSPASLPPSTRIKIQRQNGTVITTFVSNLANAVKSGSESLFLESGTYKITIETPEAFDFGSLGIVFNKYNYDKPIKKWIGGGVRIKHIKHFDMSDPSKSIERSYSYADWVDSTVSAGVLVTKPKYVTNGFTVFQEYNGSPGSLPGCWNPSSYNVRSSFPGNIYSLSGGGYVYYPKAVEYNIGNGEIKYEFFENTSFTQIHTPPFKIISKFWKEGLLKRKRFYDNESNLLMEEKYEYLYDTLTNYPPVRCVRVSPHVTCPADQIYANGEYQTNRVYFDSYDLVSESLRYKSIETVVFQASALLISTQRKQWFDKGTGNLEREEFVNSKDDTLVTLYNYQPDCLLSEPLCDRFKRLHLVSLPLEKRYYRNGNLLNTIRSIYSLKNNGGVIPSKIQKSLYNYPLQDEVLFKTYDARDNLLENLHINGIKEVYLWGYNGQYPVAKIVGSDYYTVNNIVNQASIDAATNTAGNDAGVRALLQNIRTHFSAHPLVQVSTYTYKPLVGLTSETDPTGRTIYYEYDSFNRLKLQKDEQGNILKKYCYNYAGQPIDCN